MNPSKYFKKTWKKNDNIESNTAILPLVPYKTKNKKKNKRLIASVGDILHIPRYINA